MSAGTIFLGAGGKLRLIENVNQRVKADEREHSTFRSRASSEHLSSHRVPPRGTWAAILGMAGERGEPDPQNGCVYQRLL